MKKLEEKKGRKKENNEGNIGIVAGRPPNCLLNTMPWLVPIL